MSYQAAFEQAWQTGGPEGALAFLREIFHDPKNQAIKGKPTDYLGDDDDDDESEDDDTPRRKRRRDKQKTPAEGYDQLIRLFAPEQSAEQRAAFIMEMMLYDNLEEQHQTHRLQPFNALKLSISTYGHGGAVLDSVNFDPETKICRKQYGLNHEILDESDNYDPENDDDEDSYAFIYALENKPVYELRYGDEKLSGKLLFRHVRTAQYARWLGQITDELLKTEAFADFPKQFPFRFLVVDAEQYAKDGRGLAAELGFHAPLTAEGVRGLPLGERLIASAQPLPEPTIEDQWAYLHRFADKPKAPEHKKLLEILKKNDALFEATLEIAGRSLGLLKADLEQAEPVLPQPSALAVRVRRSAPPVEYLRLFFSLGARRADAARGFARELLALPPPTLPRKEIEEAIPRAEAAIEALFGAFRAIPERERSELEPDFNRARARLAEVDHPILRVLALESELIQVHGEDAIQGAGDDEVSYELEEIPPAYVDAVAACLDEMPEKFEWYGPKWSFVMGRLQGLGEHATSVAPKVVELMNRYCTDLHDGGQALENFARLLYALKLDEPPPLIREYAERKEYHNIDHYKEWAKAAPERCWQRFVERFAADRAVFEVPAAWEGALYDSDTGMKIFAAGIAAKSDGAAVFDALVSAAKKTPGPLLTRLIYEIAGEKIPEVAEAAQKVVRLLSAVPSLDEEHRKMLQLTRLLLLRLAIDAGEDRAGEMLIELLGASPENATLLFFRAELTELKAGAERAAQETLSALKTLSRDDRVYQKAFFQLTGNEAETWESAKLADGYAIFRVALDHYKDKQYREGVFDGGERALAQDPYYQGLEKAYSWKPEELSTRLAEAKEELALADTLQKSTSAELSKLLSKERFNFSRQIVQRLMKEHERYAPEILKTYDWFRKDEERRLSLLKLMWPTAAFRPALLAHKSFQTDLPWFFKRYPLGTVALVKECFGLLNDRGHYSVVLDVAKKLDGDLITNTFLSIDRAIRGVAVPSEGVALLERVVKKVNKKKPEYVLVNSNLAVMHLQAGDKKAAEEVFDKLFATDFSRFDYQPKDEDDDFMSEILGGDLDAQIAGVFRQYFASAKYNAACLYALTERPEEAVAALREARLKHPGPYGVAKLSAEHDFDPIREHPSFAQLLSEIASEGQGEVR